jgi:hypothetical protein
MITHVSIKTEDGRVWSLPKPNRHGHVIHFIHQQLGREQALRMLTKHVQGFLNDKQLFLDRVEAWQEAKLCNQILPPYNPIDPTQRVGKAEDIPGYERNDKMLFSEDIW